MNIYRQETGKSMQRAVIISGGNIDEDLALRFLSRKPFLIAADRGLKFLEAHGISADLIVGDFDSSPP